MPKKETVYIIKADSNSCKVWPPIVSLTNNDDIEWVNLTGDAVELEFDFPDVVFNGKGKKFKHSVAAGGTLAPPFKVNTTLARDHHHYRIRCEATLSYAQGMSDPGIVVP